MPIPFISKFPLTREQYRVIKAAVVDKEPTLLVIARAGTGKTATLEAIANNTNRLGLYLVFSKKNQEEAEKRMPANVITKTIHGLAFQRLQVQKVYGRKLFSKIKYLDKYRTLGLVEALVPGRNRYRTVQDVEATVRNFCHSADLEITEDHLPDVLWISMLSEFEQKSYKLSNDKRFRDIGYERLAFYLNRVIALSKEYWTMATDPHFMGISLGHDHYLKLFHLSRPTLDYEFIMGDEMQDSDPITIDLIAQQTCQKILVGDPEQAIFGFRKAVNALERFRDMGGCKTLYLTKSFRFGEAVANIANAVLYKKGARLKRVVGYEQRESFVGTFTREEKRTVVCRTNNEIFKIAVDTIYHYPETKMSVVGGIKDAVDFVESGYWLRVKRLARHVDKDKMTHDEIRQFDSWDEVEEAAKSSVALARLILMLDKYGEDIPSIVERLRNFKSHPQKYADLVLTTCHKAKGLEWDNVVMANDFKTDLSELPPDKASEELNILYVAATRGLYKLQINAAAQLALEAHRNRRSMKLSNEGYDEGDIDDDDDLDDDLDDEEDSDEDSEDEYDDRYDGVSALWRRSSPLNALAAGFVPTEPCDVCGCRHFVRRRSADGGGAFWQCLECCGIEFPVGNSGDEPIPEDFETLTIPVSSYSEPIS